MTTRRTSPPLVVLACLLAAVAWTLVGGAAAAAPTTTTERIVIGSSVDGRPIVAEHRYHPGATRTVLVIGSLHGDEVAGLRVVRRLRHRGLPSSLDLWTIRSVNPDGVAADRRTNAHHVDLNRNFPRRWVARDVGSSTWSGPAAASEPETRALMAFVRQIQPRTTLVFHQPLHGVDSYRAKSPRLVRRLAAEMSLPVKSFSCGGGCHGTFTDWLNDRTEGRAVTVELGARPSDWRIAAITRGLVRAVSP